jgi:hypothetical protein
MLTLLLIINLHGGMTTVKYPDQDTCKAVAMEINDPDKVKVHLRAMCLPDGQVRQGLD